MLEEFLGKKVLITTSDGTIHHNMQVLDVEGTLIKVQDSQGNTKVINTASPDFSEIQLQS